MAKTFCFVSRKITISFFEDDPIEVTLRISDAMDELLLTRFSEETKKPLENVKAYFAEVVGDDKAEAIYTHIEEDGEDVDSYAVAQLLVFAQQTYFDEKVKNLQAAKRGGFSTPTK